MKLDPHQYRARLRPRARNRRCEYGLEDGDEHSDDYESNDELDRYSTIYMVVSDLIRLRTRGQGGAHHCQKQYPTA
jgi:hypothetical protein